LIKLKANTPNRILFAFLIAGAILTPIMASAFSRLAIFIPLGVGLIAAYKAVPDGKMAKFLCMAMFAGAQAIVLMFLTSSIPGIAAAGILAHFGIHVFWSGYLLMWVVPSFILNFAVYWVVVPLLFHPAKAEFTGSIDTLELFKEEYKKLPPITAEEKRLAGWLILIVLLWATDFLTNLDPGWVGVLGTVGIMLPGIGVMKPKDLQARLNFLLVLFFAAAMSIPAIIAHLRLGKWLVGILAHMHFALSNMSFSSAFLLGGITQLLHIILSASTTTVVVATPIFLSLAARHGVSLVWVAWNIFAQTFGLIFPYQYTPILMIYGLGYIKMRDMIKLGLTVSVLYLVLIPILSVVWWSWTIPLAVR
jgi:di/tricarboxylate transporter